MVFEVPKAKASIRQNRFEFKMPDGKKYWVPLLEFIKPSLALKFADLELTTDEDGNKTADAKVTSELVRLLFEAYYPDKDLFAQFDDSDQFAKWMEAWAEASGASLGESAASPKS
jgi:hypothetical protein